MYEIEIQNEHDYPVDTVRLQQAVRTVLQGHSAPANSAITIVIDRDEAITELNRRYRGIDAPTDVLSFPADAPPVDLPGEPVYLGDLVIGHPYASAQAQREGHALGDSLVLLVVHGTLHLLGFDHDIPSRKAAMWAAQADALTALGVPLEIVPALEGSPHDE